MSTKPTSTIERQGRWYEIWRIGWPRFWRMAQQNPGPLGLTPPPRTPDMVPETDWRSDAPWWERKLFRNRFRVKASTDWWWWEGYAWANVRRIIASGNGEVLHYTYVIGAVLITAATIVAGMVGSLRFTIATSIYLVVIVAAIVFSQELVRLIASWMFYVASRSLCSLPPREYAEIALLGKTESDVLRALSYEMRAGCQEFLLQTEKLDNFYRQGGDEWVGITGTPTSEQRKLLVTKLIQLSALLKADLATYEKQSAEGRENLRRLLELKEVAIIIFGIPKRKLCDHILDYSPAVHMEMAQQYARLWSRLLRVVSETEPNEDDVQRLAERCRRLRRRYQISANRLTELFQMDDLHGHVHRIASRHSTSGAVQEYAHALRQIALSSPLRNDDLTMAEAVGVIEKRLSFMYRMQKAYPGLDVHETSLRLLKKVLEVNARNEWNLFLEDKMLQAQISLLERVQKDEHKYLSRGPGRTNENDYPTLVRRNIEAIELLPRTVDAYLDKSRAKIAYNFWKFIQTWLQSLPNINTPQTFILTHGYSKTVREVLKARTELSVRGLISKSKVLIMTSDEEGLDDARKMRYELEEEMDYRAEVVATGDANVLATLAHAGDRVIVVLGAECYDLDRRVIHPHGAREKLLELREAIECRSIRLLVCVVAEGYKCRAVSPSDVTFFQDHMEDRLDIYTGDLIEAIISDDNSTSVFPGRDVI